MKKDYLDGMGDTFDLVPIGAWMGRGKRTGVYGGFLLACYDPDTESYQSISKIGTGFSDEQLKDFTDKLTRATSSLVTRRKTSPMSGWSLPWSGRSSVPTSPCPPSIKSVSFSLILSQAGVGRIHDSKGIAMRFPRLVRVRDDKTPENATSAAQVVEMYRSQKNNHTIVD